MTREPIPRAWFSTACAGACACAVALTVACSPTGDDAAPGVDGAMAADAAPPGTPDAAPPGTPDAAPPGTPDAAPLPPDATPDTGCPDVFREFQLDELESHSNVCVDGATCTFVALAGDTCSAEVTCDYELAGRITAELSFDSIAAGVWTASFVSGTRLHEFVYRTGSPDRLAYRVRGSVTDQHLCVFTDGDTAPVFPVRGAGTCPDVTRTYRLYRLDPHLCSNTLRCGLFQSAADACAVDAFCTYPTGTTEEFAGLELAPSAAGTSAVVVGDSTEDPMYPERYELRVWGDFDTGAGGVSNLEVDYYFGAGPDPSCQWQISGG